MGECRLMVTLACHGPFRGHLLCECRLVVTLATQSPWGYQEALCGCPTWGPLIPLLLPTS